MRISCAADAVLRFGRMVRFSHTIFALPFALSALVLAARGHGITLGQVLAILMAMVGARTAAMGFNRIADRRIDALNPRTAGREIPTGKVSLGAAIALTAAATGLFVLAAAWLGPLCLGLSPLVLLFVFGYSLTKRFTWLCHLVLGFAIGMSPSAVWIAIRGELAAPAVWLTVAVTTWIGGFDVIYALPDRDFDRSAGVHSIPARFGVKAALIISALVHLVTVAAMLEVGRTAGLGAIYTAGSGLLLLILVWEHSIVRPNDLSRVDVAFFSLNGYVSVIYLVMTVLDVVLIGQRAVL